MDFRSSSSAHGLALVAGCLTGCFSHATQIDRHVERGDVRVHVQSARAAPAGDVRLTAVFERVPRNVGLLRATLGSVPVGSCEAGLDAEQLGRSQARTVDAALVPGERITFGFHNPAFPYLLGAEPRLDLLLLTPLGSQRCIPIPLSEQRELYWEPVERWTFGVGFSLEGFTDRIGAVSQIVTLPLEVGVWLGDYHLELGAGFGGAGCSEDRCEAPSPDQTINYSTIFPIHAGVRRALFEWSELSLGAQLRYRAMQLAADTFQGPERYWIHGPVLSPYIAAVPAVHEGASKVGGSRAALVGLDVPIGYVFAETGQRALSVGFNLTLFFPVL